MPVLRRNGNDGSGSKARITAPQHRCPLYPNEQISAALGSKRELPSSGLNVGFRRLRTCRRMRLGCRMSLPEGPLAHLHFGREWR
jgi:hypothetical protein